MRSAALVVLLLLLPETARPQSIIRDRSRHTRPPDLSFLVGLPFPVGLGAGMRFGIPVAHDGFIGSINDAVVIEPGFQFLLWSDFDRTRAGFQVPVLMRWDFFLTRDWTVFGAVGPVFGYFFADRARDRFDVRGHDVFRPGGRPHFFHVAIGGGAFYNFGPDAALRLDASTNMLAVGILLRL